MFAGRSFTFKYLARKSSGDGRLGGKEVASWSAHHRARPGDAIALCRHGGRVLIQHVANPFPRASRSSSSATSSFGSESASDEGGVGGGRGGPGRCLGMPVLAVPRSCRVC